MEITVDEFLFGPCSRGVLDDKVSDGSEYWERAYNFIEENKDKYLGELSFPQRNWLIKIKDALLE